MSNVTLIPNTLEPGFDILVWFYIGAGVMIFMLLGVFVLCWYREQCATRLFVKRGYDPIEL